jgi:hypothetical protein
MFRHFSDFPFPYYYLSTPVFLGTGSVQQADCENGGNNTPARSDLQTSRLSSPGDSVAILIRSGGRLHESQRIPWHFAFRRSEHESSTGDRQGAYLSGADGDVMLYTDDAEITPTKKTRALPICIGIMPREI